VRFAPRSIQYSAARRRVQASSCLERCRVCHAPRPKGAAGQGEGDLLLAVNVWGAAWRGSRASGCPCVVGGSKYVPGAKRIAGTLGVPSSSDLGEANVIIGELDHDDDRTPRGHRGRQKDQQPFRPLAAKNRASWYCSSWRGLQSDASTPDSRLSTPETRPPSIPTNSATAPHAMRGPSAFLLGSSASSVGAFRTFIETICALG